MNPNMKSEVEVNMELRSSSAKFNTDGRTDKRTKTSLTNALELTFVGPSDGSEIATVGDVIGAGLWPTGERHEVVRRGDRAEIPKHTRVAVWFRDKGRCRLCPPEKRIDGPWHLDHIQPWSSGGPDTSDNLRVLCEKHNLERSNHVIAEERPESLVTWWCSRCYMLDEHKWEYFTNALPECPLHATAAPLVGGKMLANGRCAVQRGYAKTYETTGVMPTWHQRAPIEELHAVAFCAHCGTRGLTGVTL